MSQNTILSNTPEVYTLPEETNNVLSPSTQHIDYEKEIINLQQQVYSFLLIQLKRLEQKELIDSVMFWQNKRTTLMSRISDIAPIIGCLATGGHIESVFPIASYWILSTLAFRQLDDFQDYNKIYNQSHPYHSLYSAFAMQSVATVFLCQTISASSKNSIMETCTATMTALCEAQSMEAVDKVPTKEDYFNQIIGKTGNITATAFWSGGYIGNNESPYLDTLFNFGMATGSMAQIQDDCIDLYEDIYRGHYTLPVICALSNKQDKEGAVELEQLIAHNTIDKRSKANSDKIASLVVQLDGIMVAQEVAQNYQTCALKTLNMLPSSTEKKIMSIYVTPNLIS